MSSNKHALIVDGVVDAISFYPDRDAEGNIISPWVAVPDDVFAGFLHLPNGSFSPPLPQIIPPTADDVVAERERRLALGFDFDFGDARGVHRIGTSSDDMRKWMDEVTPLAQVYVNLGQLGSEITITTETGVAVITANEWQSILIAAAGYRQPLYAASFALQAMDPIPADFATNPAYWP